MRPEARQPGPQEAAGPSARPRLRVVSCLDAGTGLRFLSADGTIFPRWGVWSLPFAVGATNTHGEPLPWLTDASLEPLFQGLARVDGGAAPLWVRTGLIPEAPLVDRVGEYLQTVKPAGYVFDPELFDGDGRPRVGAAAVEAFRRKLLPASDVVIVNRHEAAALTGRPVEGLASMRDACRALIDRGAGAAIATGAHLEGAPREIVYDGHGFDEVGADRIALSGALRGAGGIFSAVVTAALIRGRSLPDAAELARRAASSAIEARLRVTRAGLLRVDEIPAEGAQGGVWIANPSRVAPPA